jgi:hypothetical protein
MSPTAPRLRPVHLVSRFFESLRARRIDDATRGWVTDSLEPAELAVWQGMSGVDQAEGAAVARRLDVALAGTPEASDPRWRAAALLHDAGKQESGFGPVGRSVVTLVAVVAGPSRLRGWVDAPSPTRARMGRYVAHDELGAERLRRAGARPEVAAWAGAHHHPSRWAATGIPGPVCRALAAADGEPAQ